MTMCVCVGDCLLECTCKAYVCRLVYIWFKKKHEGWGGLPWVVQASLPTTSKCIHQSFTYRLPSSIHEEGVDIEGRGCGLYLIIHILSILIYED